MLLSLMHGTMNLKLFLSYLTSFSQLCKFCIFVCECDSGIFSNKTLSLHFPVRNKENHEVAVYSVSRWEIEIAISRTESRVANHYTNWLFWHAIIKM
jgi:hypothetical protein